MRRTIPLVVALVLVVTATDARAEVAVGTSLEWLTCTSDLLNRR